MQTIKWETVARYLFTYVISKNTHEMGEKYIQNIIFILFKFHFFDRMRTNFILYKNPRSIDGNI